ncbi:coagulation factor XIII A chain [Brienomyrus brachyistius]|uniref:coagulation factor XIII A chain n=1 Tax=Brienomyrus brachyistius TaxID=42636 RepID=UPI0020B26314|nr:coagulation factor XIII A chain [Brienomyrus brachyistius]
MATQDPSPRPGPVSYRGRSSLPMASSNTDDQEVLQFEPFQLMPRGPPPLKEFLDIWDVNNLNDINKKQHHTDLYANDNLIVRRAQEFQIRITFDRAYNPLQDQFLVEFVMGRYPQVSKGTYIPIRIDEERPQSWQGRVLESKDNMVTVGITATPDCIVGKFRMYVAVITPYGIRRTQRDPNTDVYILFNPWSQADSVYLDDEAELGECILNETGVLYHGEVKDISVRPWSYGQFEYGILDACLYVMDKASMPLINRGDAVKVARMASAMMNSKDDDGVLVGNWSGDYIYGVAPTAWTGSVEILLNYANSGMPVCYAQCWVYAAVFNTFLRCLGIPARVVTNFYSAHDNNGNLKTDLIVDENGQVDKERTKDSIWNYHCWNECYMARPDLPQGFGGWQVVDATPQETSDGLYRCGPASVYAIKHGQVCYPFDAPFVFAEVNSDVVFYKRNKNGTLEQVKVDKTHVGQLVLTKDIGSDKSRDITSQYKFPEGTEEERTVLEKAEEFGCSRVQSTLPPADVELRITVQDVMVGNDFQLSLEFKNLTELKRTASVYISGNIVYYTGVTSSEFKFKTQKVKLEPFEYKKVTLDVNSKEYLSKLVEQANLNFIITGRIPETGQIISAMQVVALHTPKLSVKVSGSQKVSEESFVTVEFTNPFKYNLENVSLRVEGPGLMKAKNKVYSVIPPNSSLTWTESFSPWRPGPAWLIASLDCAALRQVYGHVEVNIQSSEGGL